MTSTEALRLEELPARLAVLGGGYIAAELSHVYSTMGSKVSIIVRSKVLRTVSQRDPGCGVCPCPRVCAPTTPFFFVCFPVAQVDPEIREDFVADFKRRVDCLEGTDVDEVQYDGQFNCDPPSRCCVSPPSLDS